MITALNRRAAGAMENKSLNVFNSRLVLASPESASDMDFERIQVLPRACLLSPPCYLPHTMTTPCAMRVLPPL